MSTIFCKQCICAWLIEDLKIINVSFLRYSFYQYRFTFQLPSSQRSLCNTVCNFIFFSKFPWIVAFHLFIVITLHTFSIILHCSFFFFVRLLSIQNFYFIFHISSKIFLSVLIAFIFSSLDLYRDYIIACKISDTHHLNRKSFCFQFEFVISKGSLSFNCIWSGLPWKFTVNSRSNFQEYEVI